MPDPTLTNAEAFATRYPDAPARFSIAVDTALMKRDCLTRLASELPPHLVEFNSGALPVSIEPEDVPTPAARAEEIIARLDRDTVWMTLRNIEHNTDYRRLCDAVANALAGVAEAATGAMLQRENFIFLSSAGAVTPFHIDEEHNVLIQIEGRKTVRVFSQHDRRLASQRDLEAFHAGGHRNLILDPAYAGDHQAFDLAPGDALYIPPLAPHWVSVAGDEPALSLSITWRSEATRRAVYLHQINHRLRQFGARPRFPGATPVRDQVKIWGASALARLVTPFQRDRRGV
ncbi:MAG: cupin domain-containing protein [Pseudomonadota bacterium]